MSAEVELLAGRYRLVRSIGEGGAGVVYEAVHEDLGKRVAVKLLHPNRAQDETVSKRFKREARAVAAIGHRAIVDVYDIGRSDEGALFLVMELLEGRTLRELLRKEGFLESSLTTYVMSSVLSALEAAHRTGIVHRDIKPENIFLVRTGQHRPAVKLLDFGVSRFTDPALEDTKLTQSNTILGTPLYMSPEQAAGEKDVDHLTDIYATGSVMYECITGRPPFMADNLLALAAKIQTETPRHPSELRPDISKDLEATVLKAIARDRESRFQDASAFLDALLPIVDDVDRARISIWEPRSAPPSSPSPNDESTEPEGSTEEASLSDMPKRELASSPSDERAMIEQADTLGPTVNSAETDQGPTRRGRSRPIIIASVVAVGLIGAFALVVVSPWTRDQQVIESATGSGETATPPVLAKTPPTEPAPVAHDGAPPAETLPAEQVHITLVGVPERATIHVDGAVVDVEDGVLTVNRDDRDIPVEVSAVGYQTWRGTVSARESGTTRVRLRRRRQPLRGPKQGERPQNLGTKKLPSFGVGP